jgi:hypothetical protein
MLPLSLENRFGPPRLRPFASPFVRGGLLKGSTSGVDTNGFFASTLSWDANEAGPCPFVAEWDIAASISGVILKMF